MSDAVEHEKKQAEQRLEEEITTREKNFMKELEQIKAIHRMEKEQIEHRAQKAKDDLQMLQIDHSKLIQSQSSTTDPQCEELLEQLKQQELMMMQMQGHVVMVEERHLYEKSQLLANFEAAEADYRRKKQASAEHVESLNAKIATLTARL